MYITSYTFIGNNSMWSEYINMDYSELSLPQYTDLIGDVDKLLYQAKERGRSRAVSNMGEFVFKGTNN